MTWDEFLWFAIPAMLCWIGAGSTVYMTKKKVSSIFMLSGIIIFASFIAGLGYGRNVRQCAPSVKRVYGIPFFLLPSGLSHIIIGNTHVCYLFPH